MERRMVSEGRGDAGDGFRIINCRWRLEVDAIDRKRNNTPMRANIAGSVAGDGRLHVGEWLRWLSHHQRSLEAREGRCRLLSAMVKVGGWREEIRIKQSDRLLSARHEL
jgi:hypothetical protein